MEICYRQATADDAPFLAHLVRQVSGGLVDALLDGLLPGVTPEQIVSMVLRDTSSQWSYTNCLLALDDEPAGLLFAYPSSVQTIPPLMETMLSRARLDPLRDSVTAAVPESLYINTLWVAERVRGMGLADALIDYARAWAKDLGLHTLSLFVWRDNLRARSFYARHGFSAVRSVAIPEPLLSAHGGADLLASQCAE
ncbi:MAG: GNAT family N-acetyltransferase [Desulfovibrionaceae bacterium]|nr:GNAT family N-acetyltransferase [Desulfovibrionaceae bacterium]